MRQDSGLSYEACILPGSERLMEQSHGSTRVIYAALGGNVAIAIAKLVAYGVSGSSAMLTEAVHSFVDSVDQILLLIAQSRARKQRDRSHPLGYGMETYFWSFIVAVMVMLAGGVASIYQGVHALRTSEPLASATVSLVVLAIAAGFEGSSFSVAFREYKRIVRGRDTPLWTFIRRSKDPGLYATLLEDFSALIGIGFAALGVIASTMFHIHWADGAASIAIGALLMTVSVVLANETRSLIAGEAVAAPVLEKLQRALASEPRVMTVHDIATLHLGPHIIMVALTISFVPEMELRELRTALRDITKAFKDIDGRIAYVYVRPREEDGNAERQSARTS
jgi:cation diffusion facilitator family transporter